MKSRQFNAMVFKMGFIAAFFLCSIAVCLIRQASADEIIMKNGDRLKGKIISMSSGKLVFETAYDCKITLPWDKVDQLSSDDILEISLPGKETLRGRAVKGEEGLLILKPETGSVSKPIALSKVSSLSPPKPPEHWKWKGNASAGIDYQTGNTDKQSYSGDLNVSLEKFPYRMTLYGEVYYEKDKGEESENKARSNFDYSRFFDEHWYVFGYGRGQMDKFSDLSFLGTVSAGGGYQLWNSDEKNLSIKLGPAYSREYYSNPQTFLEKDNSRAYAAAFWAFDFDMWFFKKHVQLFHHDDLNISLNDSRNWRAITRTGIRIPLIYHIFTSLQYNYDWVNQPADGKLHYDSRVLFKLGWRYEPK
jgi:putative salt-induced outer membrane protein YdiY